MTTKKTVRDSINNARSTADVEMPDIEAVMNDFNSAAKAQVAKFAIGFAYAWVGFIASWNIAVMCAMVTSIAFFQYLIVAGVFAACLALLVYAVPVATEATYVAGEWVASKLGSLFAKAKNALDRDPAPSTVH